MQALYKKAGTADNTLGFLNEKQLLKLAKKQAAANKADGVLVLYEENLRSYQLFERFRSQVISVGMGGIVGLNYIPVQHYLDRITKTDDEWEDLFSDFQACESAMVKAISSTK